jgi:hypothetical protein
LSKSCVSTWPICGSCGSSMARAIGFSRNARTRSMPRYWNGFKAWPRRNLQSSARMLHLVFDCRIVAGPARVKDALS